MKQTNGQMNKQMKVETSIQMNKRRKVQTNKQTPTKHNKNYKSGGKLCTFFAPWGWCNWPQWIQIYFLLGHWILWHSVCQCWMLSASEVEAERCQRWAALGLPCWLHLMEWKLFCVGIWKTNCLYYTKTTILSAVQNLISIKQRTFDTSSSSTFFFNGRKKMFAELLKNTLRPFSDLRPVCFILKLFYLMISAVWIWKMDYTVVQIMSSNVHVVIWDA